MEDSNNKESKPDLISKVEESTVIYNSEVKYTRIEEHPLFAKVIEKSIKEADGGKGFTTEEVMKKIKEKHPFLK